MKKGATLGRLTRTNAPPIYQKTASGNRAVYEYEMQCACGTVLWVKYRHLKNGKRSCGCLRAEREMNHNGLSGLDGGSHPLYQKWYQMVERCHNAAYHNYKSYGGRGISVCQDWLYSFENFYYWCISQGYEVGQKLDLDRFPDNDGNYCPNNCRLIPHEEHVMYGVQQKTKLITAFGEQKTIRGWFEDPRRHPDLKLNSLRKRLYSGWEPEDAIIAPPLFIS